MVKAILFDIDGTILDTREYIFQSFEHALKTHGLSPKERSLITKIVGPPLEECYRLLTELEDVTSLAEAHRQFQVDNLELVTPFPTTEETLKELKKRNIKIAGVTTRTNRSSIGSLQISNLYHYFDIVISKEDVTNLKPHPEPLLKALKHIGQMPNEALMVGDTNIDIEAGKNAGVKTVGVTYGFHGKKIKDAKPDYVIHDIKELLAII